MIVLWKENVFLLTHTLLLVVLEPRVNFPMQ